MRVAIFGSGIVGQATGIGLTANGFDVTFYDVNKSKLLDLQNEGYSIAENSDDVVDFAQVLFVCVPTPTVSKKIDYRYIDDCTKTIGKALKELKNIQSLLTGARCLLRRRGPLQRKA